MAGASVTKTAELSDVEKNTVSKVMTAFEKELKTSSPKQNSGRKRKLSDRDRQTFTQIVRKDHKNTAQKIFEDLNDNLENPGKLEKGTVRISQEVSNQKTILKFV